MSRKKASLSESVARWLPVAGLAGLIGTYWFMADAVPALVAASPRLTMILGDSANSRGLYLGLSCLLAVSAAAAPVSFAAAGSAFFSLILFVAASIAILMLGALTLLVIMIGMDQDTFPRMINWMLVSALFVTPVALINLGVVWLLSITGKGLQHNRQLRLWEILVLLLGASWLGLLIGWSV